MSIDHNNQINFMPPAGVSRLGRCSDSGAAAPILEVTPMNATNLYSDAALYAKTKHYFRKWEKLCRHDGCSHPDQPLTSKVCWLQSLLLRKFKTGTPLPRDVLQYLVGYRLVAFVLLGRTYV